MLYNDLLDEESKLHLGGYLVCLLVDLRSKTSLTAGRYAEGLCEKLSRTLSRFFDSNDSEDQIQMLEEADRILSAMDDLLTDMGATKYREFLSPIYEKRDLLFSEKDQKLCKLLEVFYDDYQPTITYKNMLVPIPISVWPLTNILIHDIRKILGKIGSSLLSLYNEIQNKDGLDALRVDTEVRDLFHFLIAELPFSMEDFQSNFLWMQAALFEAYDGSKFHKKAAELMTERLWKVIDPASAFGELLKYMLVSSPPQNDPHVTPLIDLIKEAVPREQVEDILLNDSFVVQLKQRLEAL